MVCNCLHLRAHAGNTDTHPRRASLENLHEIGRHTKMCQDLNFGELAETEWLDSEIKINTRSVGMYCTFSFKSTGGVTRDPFYLFDNSAAAEFLRDTSKISTLKEKLMTLFVSRQLKASPNKLFQHVFQQFWIHHVSFTSDWAPGSSSLSSPFVHCWQ
jgi:hypothetical protein